MVDEPASDEKFEKSEGKKMNKTKEEEMLREKQHLLSCLDKIFENIQMYEEKETSYRKEVTELFQAVKKGDGDSYGQLMAGQHLLEHSQNMLRKSKAALKKAYFGRVDYDDLTYGVSESRYIGKNGVTTKDNEVLIVDWRAPLSSVYYENELGRGSYAVPDNQPIEVQLYKKRTYDVQEDKLLGYYDDDVAANDELLVKYLSQNKEAVLGDIIATIQKEQNEIIRDVPYKNIIVQGVAGSGKTTVALHRISYILYNYENKYKPSEFCIVGSSDMLLNYISSGLPELDVNYVKQMRMDVFLPHLMGKAWKKNYRIIADDEMAPVKSRLHFMRELEGFLENWREKVLPAKTISDNILGIVLSESDMADTLVRNKHLSIMQLEKLFNERIRSRIKFLCTEISDALKTEKKQQYKKYFDFSKCGWIEVKIYLAFLEYLKEQQLTCDEDICGRSMDSSEKQNFWQDTITHVNDNRFDLYDVAALGLIWKRILVKKEVDEFSQIIIDEAQDFGESIYYVMKQLLTDCHFTIMGDVSQNIRYETGMNDWDGLKEVLFEQENDSFYLLAKSYRNTIEISECAGKVLEKASQGSYKIEPVIRHGIAVLQIQETKENLPQRLQSLIEEIKRKSFETIAVVCRSEEEAQEVKGYLDIEETGEHFHNGVMVLPVTLTKGLEFDAVILWKPDEDHYGMNPKEAKLLYVAITRALHELYLVGDKEMSGLFL